MNTFKALAAVTLAASTSFLFATTTFAEDRISYGSFAPAAGPEAIAIQALMERTSDKIKWEFHPAGALIGFQTTVSGLGDGLVDAAFVVDVGAPTQLANHMVMTDLAMIDAPLMALTGAVNETMLLSCPACREEAAEANILPLAYHAAAPFHLMCTKPVGSLADLAGRSIRARSAFAGYVSAMGGTPVATSPTEIYEAMQRGQVDCAIGGVIWLKSYGLADVVETTVSQPLGQYNTGMILGMNVDSWDGLSDDGRKTVSSNLAYLVRSVTELHMNSYDADKSFAMDAGVSFDAVPDDLAAATAQYRANEFARASAAAAEAGLDQADAMVSDFRKNLAKWIGIAGEIGTDMDAYEEVLNREIFSKLEL